MSENTFVLHVRHVDVDVKKPLHELVVSDVFVQTFKQDAS